jgi:DNA polymerase-3 subunit delta'
LAEIVFHSKLEKRQPFATRLLSNAVIRGRLVHAYLLVGRAQADKWDIARDLACFLNCAHVAAGNTDEACTLKADIADEANVDLSGFCQNCRWIWQHKHPQAWLTLLSEGTKSGKISVEKARSLSGELAKESQFVRVVVVENASQEIFHRPAANALLKTIEDPKANCIFMLFATSVGDVLPTVVSRCQVLPLYTTDSMGMTLRATDLSSFDPDAVRITKEAIENHFHRHDAQSLSRVIDFSRAINELLTEEFTAGDAVDLMAALEFDRIANRALVEANLSRYAAEFLLLCENTKGQLDHYVSPKAALESFALSWWRLTATISTRAIAQ